MAKMIKRVFTCCSDCLFLREIKDGPVCGLLHKSMHPDLPDRDVLEDCPLPDADE